MSPAAPLETPILETARLLAHAGGFTGLRAVDLLLRVRHFDYRRYVSDPRVRVWTNLAMPNVIFYAMGLVPIFTENVSAILAAVRRSVEPLDRAAECLLSPGSCNYINCALGALELGYLPLPRVFVMPNYICEDDQKMAHFLSWKHRIPLFLIDVPRTKDDAAERYVAAQLQELPEFLAEHTAGRLEPRRLRRAIHRFNAAAAYWRQVERIRATTPHPLVPGGSGLRLLGAFSKFGSAAGVRIARTLRDEIAERARQALQPPPAFRLLWLHLYPYYQSSLFRYLERRLGAYVVYEESNSIALPRLSDSDPYGGMARILSGVPVYGGVRHRVRNVLRLVRLFRVDGVIHSTHLGCRASLGHVPHLRGALRASDLPFLELVWDNIDHRNFGAAQVRTRLEAFVEGLRARRGATPR